ncbi:hypothetical protein [Tenacibaculum sp. C7A-26P2]|uniref:hypothetical protein n=1 Tax=Tenacibaculum sp. C7A-26P2 TaxID=3447504 RepID=UPI003F863405
MSYKDLNIQQLLNLSKKASSQINLQVQILDTTFSELLKNLPQDEANEIDKLKALTQKAISLAKQGKAEEAQEIIRNYQNGRKSNK